MSGVVGVLVEPAHAAGELLKSGVEHADPEALFEALMEIADGIQFLLDPGRLNPFLECADCSRGEVVGLDGVEGSFGSEHATLNREMNAFQTLRVEESGRVAEDHPTITADRRN